jgi:hypothetical protein
MKSVLAAIAALCIAGPAHAAADYLLEIKSVAAWSASGPIELKVQSSGDSDGDGVADTGTLRLTCSGPKLRSASYRLDPAAGKAAAKSTGKSWNPASPQLMRHRPGYDLATLKGARRAADADGWVTLGLQHEDCLCTTATEVAKGTASKSRSNIQNN